MGALFGVIVSLVIGAMAIPVMKQAINANLNAIVLADVASQFQTVLTGGQKYVAANKDTLTDTLRVGGAYQEIPFVALLNTDSLPGGFSQTNAVGATWHVYAQQPASGAIRTMVTAMGGRTLSQSDLVKIAGLTGDLGGYVPYDGMLGNLSSSAAHGTTWNLSLAGLPSPGPGHLFGTTTVGDAASPTIDTNDFLYRVGVPGHDNLNTMDVTLNMGGNTITNAGTVSAVRGVFANTVTVTSGGCAFNAPGTCLYGDGTNTGVRTKGSVYFQHMDGSAADINANNATVQTLVTGTDNGTAAAGVACSPNGAFASSTDGTGTHLECVSGLWKTSGLTTAYQVQTTVFNTNDTGWIQNTYGSVIFVTIMWASTVNCGKNGYLLEAFVTNHGTSNVADFAQENNPDFYKTGNIYFFVSPGESWRVSGTPWNGCPNQSFQSVITVLQ